MDQAGRGVRYHEIPTSPSALRYLFAQLPDLKISNPVRATILARPNVQVTSRSRGHAPYRELSFRFVTKPLGPHAPPRNQFPAPGPDGSLQLINASTAKRMESVDRSRPITTYGSCSSVARHPTHPFRWRLGRQIPHECFTLRAWLV